jgi:glutamate synthase (NADPH/NADH) small chain
MGKPTGFMEYRRRDVDHRPASERVHDFNEMDIYLSPDDLKKQAARCMDCGVPFCHGSGCPLGNRIPEFNDHVYNGRWQLACENLHSTNNFPEITGRICPALCEASCTLGINDEPVLIRHIELQIVERGFENGWIVPLPAKIKTGKKIAIIGSGPAGLAAAQQLARMGNNVVVFEKDEKPGGLLRFGIPDFKLSKTVIDRRIEQMKAEGVDFQCGVSAGEDVSVKYLEKHFDAICLCMGAGQPRDLIVPGRDLENIHFAMEYLKQQNEINAGMAIDEKHISAKDKVVVVIGGGDTGSDCVGTAIRQGAKEVHQFEILPKPPVNRPDNTPWPTWPKIMRTSTSHEEGCQRRWSVLTKKLTGSDTQVNMLYGVEVEWEKDDKGGWRAVEKQGSEFEMKADLILLAMGFVHVVHDGIVNELGLKIDSRGNVAANDYASSKEGVFAAGDTAVGASLVVSAINHGRKMAEAVNSWLMKK